MKRIKHELAVYFYGADGSTLKFEADGPRIGKVALDLLARLASVSENKAAQKYLEEIAIDEDDLDSTTVRGWAREQKEDLDATTYKAGSLVVDRTESI